MRVALVLIGLALFPLSWWLDGQAHAITLDALEPAYTEDRPQEECREHEFFRKPSDVSRPGVQAALGFAVLVGQCSDLSYFGGWVVIAIGLMPRLPRPAPQKEPPCDTADRS